MIKTAGAFVNLENEEGNNMKINEVIRKRRKELNMTQEKIADILGVSAPAVNKWENGISYPDIILLAPLARLLEIDVNELLGFHENLSKEDVGHIVAEVSRIREENGFDAAFAKAEKAIRNYSNCIALIANLTLVMNMWLHQERETDTAPYSKKLYEWMVLVADSGDEDFAESALIVLCNEEIAKKDFDRAQMWLDRLQTRKMLDKRITQAKLYIEKGESENAYAIYETKIYENVNQLCGSLSLLSELKCRERDYDAALNIAELIHVIGVEFQRGTFQNDAAELAVYVQMQDKDNTLRLLEHMLSDADNLASKKCYLNEHIKTENRQDNETIKKMLRQMTELETFDFLRGDERFIRIIETIDGGKYECSQSGI